MAGLELIDEAIAQFTSCVQLDPKHADAYYNIGVAYGYKENGVKAMEMFEKALEIQPDHMLAGYGKKLLEKEQ